MANQETLIFRTHRAIGIPDIGVQFPVVVSFFPDVPAINIAAKIDG